MITRKQSSALSCFVVCSLMSLMQMLVTSPAHAEAESEAPSSPLDFAHQVLPILKSKCAQCHAAGKNEGELSIDTRESLVESGAVVVGKSGESELIARITSDDPDLRMPPKGEPLSQEQIAILKRWIDGGLAWEPGFTFAAKQESLPLRLQASRIPAGRSERPQVVDRYVDAYFESNKTPFPQRASDSEFLRRVSLDLTGLLPTDAQRSQFLTDASPDKRARLIDGLLNNNVAYADHWLTFWSDLLRNDYVGTGSIEGGRKQITAWLYRSLLENKPYDKFVQELIAPEQGSEGFLHGITWRGRVNSSQTVEMQFAQNVGQVFLGINLKCASCHDSFVDGWKLDNSYGIAAVAAEKPLEIHRCDLPTGLIAKPSFPFPELGDIDPKQPREQRLERLSELITDKGNGWLPRTLVNRLWHRLMGRGIVHPVDAMNGTPWSPELLDYLASELVSHNYDLKHVLKLITTSNIYAAKCVPASDASGSEFVFHGPQAKRLTAEEFFDAIWRMTDTVPKKTATKFEGRGDEPVRASLVVADLLMRSLGRPNRDQVVTTRPDDLSTLQALELTNGPEMTELVNTGAKHLYEQFRDKPSEELIAWLYLQAFCRPPTAQEKSAAAEILGSTPMTDSVADLLWCVVMLPEFQLIQ